MLAQVDPMIGIPVSLATIGSRYGATKLSERSIKDLAAMMRAGVKPKYTSRLANVPTTAGRGAAMSIYDPYQPGNQPQEQNDGL
jgi:hypothetical protein